MARVTAATWERAQELARQGERARCEYLLVSRVGELNREIEEEKDDERLLVLQQVRKEIVALVEKVRGGT